MTEVVESREARIVRLRALGLTFREIASRVDLSHERVRQLWQQAQQQPIVDYWRNESGKAQIERSRSIWSEAIRIASGFGTPAFFYECERWREWGLPRDYDQPGLEWAEAVDA